MPVGYLGSIFIKMLRDETGGKKSSFYLENFCTMTHLPMFGIKNKNKNKSKALLQVKTKSVIG